MTRSAVASLPLGWITTGLAILALVVAGVLAGHAVNDAGSDDIKVVAIGPQTELDEVLSRCRLSEAGGAGDPDCRAAWAESRDRFFARPRTETPR